MKRVTYRVARSAIVSRAGGAILPGGIVDVVTPDGVTDEDEFARRVRRVLVRHGDCRIVGPGGYLVARFAL
jgi:hypothetical protein